MLARRAKPDHEDLDLDLEVALAVGGYRLPCRAALRWNEAGHAAEET